MSRQMRVMCGVPNEFCTGGILQTDQHFSTKKCHTSRKEAINCHRRYLRIRGFVQLSSREFINPDNGAIRILPKITKFGGKLRSGKGEKGSSRFEPDHGSGLVF